MKEEKPALSAGFFAEDVGFEPTRAFTLRVFETRALGRYANPPIDTSFGHDPDRTDIVNVPIPTRAATYHYLTQFPGNEPGALAGRLPVLAHSEQWNQVAIRAAREPRSRCGTQGGQRTGQ